MNTVEINSLKKYSEFTTTFRIPFKKAVEAKCYTPMDTLGKKYAYRRQK